MPPATILQHAVAINTPHDFGRPTPTPEITTTDTPTPLTLPATSPAATPAARWRPSTPRPPPPPPPTRSPGHRTRSRPGRRPRHDTTIPHGHFCGEKNRKEISAAVFITATHPKRSRTTLLANASRTLPPMNGNPNLRQMGDTGLEPVTSRV